MVGSSGEFWTRATGAVLTIDSREGLAPALRTTCCAGATARSMVMAAAPTAAAVVRLRSWDSLLRNPKCFAGHLLVTHDADRRLTRGLSGPR